MKSIPAAPNDELSLDLEVLEARLKEEQQVGRGVIVSYGLGEVNTGGLGTDLDKVAALCKSYGAWLHVDAGEQDLRVHHLTASFRRLCRCVTGVQTPDEGHRAGR